jgi:glycosyltransferase involved in cell wall biosynthesis
MPEPSKHPPISLVFVTTEDWYFLSHRLPLAQDALKRGIAVVLASRIDRGRERLLAEGLELVDLPWRRGGFLHWRDVLAIFRLFQLYRRRRPTIVHHVALKPILFGTLAARLAGLPNIINAVAGLGFLFTAEGLRARLSRALFLFAARPLMQDRRVRFLFQNADDRACLSRHFGLAESQTDLVAGAGVDLDAFPRQPPPDNDEVIVALVARMLRIKGVDLAVSAVQRLRSEGVAIRLELVGESDEANPSAISSEALGRWNGRKGVVWHGRRDDIAAVWAKADIALLPSRGGEGLPKALLEAAASGRPLIGTNVPGIRDVVLDGVTGYLVPPDDVDALASALKRLALDPLLRRTMGEAARAHVAAHFSESQVRQAIGRLHDGLITRR